MEAAVGEIVARGLGDSARVRSPGANARVAGRRHRRHWRPDGDRWPGWNAGRHLALFGRPRCCGTRYGGGNTMTGSRKLLIFGGMTLAAFGMLYGLQYALFVEHQTLDRMGGSLAQSFSAAANRNLGQSQAALEQYGETKYDYVRQVDAHSHWIGLAMLMIVLGGIFERVTFREGIRQLVALSLLSGRALFPPAVILLT